MQAHRLDNDTVLIELEGESIIVLYPTSMKPEEVAEACEESAAKLEKRVKLYRAFCVGLTSKATKL